MTSNRYSTLLISLHWLMAIGILINWGLGWSMVDLPFSPQKLQNYAYHKWLGITLLGLISLRAIARITQGAPPLKPAAPQLAPWQITGATLAHVLLYLLMFFLPLSGWLFSSAKGFPVVYLGLWPLPDLVPTDPSLAEFWQEAHEFASYTLIVCIILHALAALKHHFINRDQVLRRMLPFLKAR